MIIRRYSKGLIPIARDWDGIKAEYIAGGNSLRELAEKYDIPFPTIASRASKEKWKANRDETANKIITKSLQKTVDAAADNAVIAERIKTKLLARLEKEIDALPDLIGTEKRDVVREVAKGKTKTTEKTTNFRLRDLTAAYKDLTEDYIRKGNGDVEDLTPLVDLLK